MASNAKRKQKLKEICPHCECMRYTPCRCQKSLKAEAMVKAALAAPVEELAAPAAVDTP